MADEASSSPVHDDPTHHPGNSDVNVVSDPRQEREDAEQQQQQQRQPLRPGSYELREGGTFTDGGAGAGTALQHQRQPRQPRSGNNDGELQKPSMDTDVFRQQIHNELKRSGAFDRIRAMVLAHARGKAEERGTLSAPSVSSSSSSSNGAVAQRNADLDVLRHILAEVTDGAATADYAVERLGLPRSDHHYLQVDVYGAKAFTMSLLGLAAAEEGGGSSDVSGGAPRLQSVVVLHLHFKGQRSMSLPVKLRAEPAFDESVLFDLGPAGSGPPAHEYMDILSQAEPLQLALMRYDIPADFDVDAHIRSFGVSAVQQPSAAAPLPPTTTTTTTMGTKHSAAPQMSDAAEFGLRQVAVNVELLATQRVRQWDRALSRPGSVYDCAVALTRAGPEAEAFRTQVPVGVLSTRFHIIAAHSGSTASDTSDSAATQPVILEEAERAAFVKKKDEASALALQQLRRYTHVWWRDFTDLATSFKHRTVQIYGEDPGSGEDQLVCQFVTPLQAHHVIESPLQAARFVSLLGYVAPRGVGQRRLIEKWPCLHSVLVQRSGSARDHAVLLCSLLLGFHLDAFVCVGTVVASAVGDDVTQAAKSTAGLHGSRVDDGEERLHYWVMTRNDAHSVTFWESLSARRFRHPPVDADASQYDYLRIGCVFNHRYFFANAQASDEVVHCDFHLEDVRAWKAMDPRIIKVQSMPVQLHVPLLTPTVDHRRLSTDLEVELQSLIREYREGIRLPTYWNDEISYLLSPALAAYEQERLYGAGGSAVAHGLFQQSVKRAVPEGASFRAYPAQCRFPQARRIMRLMLQDEAARVVAETRGSRVRFGLRVRVSAYPENAMAVWFALAVIYLPARQ